MEEQISQIRREAEEEFARAKTSQELEELRVKYLGRRGIIKEIIGKLGKLSPEERPKAGKLANRLKIEIENFITAKLEELRRKEKEQDILAESIDVTLPGRCIRMGKKHPLTLVLDEIKRIFIGLGFEVVEGPEVEWDYYNFEALNMPEYHPARDEFDSLYVSDKMLLRSHTSPMQIRTMESRQPPLRVIVPGRCHRHEAADATHSHTFHQVEGFLVDKEVTFGDLKGTLEFWAKEMFGEEVKMRFRPDYFPFTEPSAEGAISCIICRGEGCRTCSYTGWLEILGCGMIHPQVLRNVGYDPEEWLGYAFGMGVDRLAMLKYGIDDIRLFTENDLRFLRQF